MDRSQENTRKSRGSRAWALGLCLCATLLICSCRGLPTSSSLGGASSIQASRGSVAGNRDTLPAEAWSGPPHFEGDAWRPPGIAGPWPRDEYLHDGGDSGRPAAVAADWTVTGLEQNDTIAHFDTIDGRTIVEQSNRVYLYAPRFGSVRRVHGVAASRSRDVVGSADSELRLEQHDDLQIATNSHTQQQLIGDVGVRGSSVYRDRLQGGDLNSLRKVAGMRNALLPFEDFQIIHAGRYDQLEKVRLEEAIEAARTWSHDAAVQIFLDERRAITDTKDERLQSIYRTDEPNHPKLRLVKVASTESVLPGDMVDFTIRFDNVGDRVIGNVTILDNLSTRLEFVSSTDECSLKADFVTEPNPGGSLVVRWEITDPLPPGQGGVIRFRCRVR